MTDEPDDLEPLPEGIHDLLGRVRAGGPSEEARARIAAGLELGPGPGGGGSSGGDLGGSAGAEAVCLRSPFKTG